MSVTTARSIGRAQVYKHMFVWKDAAEVGARLGAVGSVEE